MVWGFVFWVKIFVVRVIGWFFVIFLLLYVGIWGSLIGFLF